MNDHKNLYVGVLFLLVILYVVVMWNQEHREKYHQYRPGNYRLMSRLPWCVPPTGIGALGERECREMQSMFPGRRFPIGKIPISIPPDGIRIYETGNAENPNTHTSWGVVGPEYITY